MEEKEEEKELRVTSVSSLDVRMGGGVFHEMREQFERLSRLGA